MEKSSPCGVEVSRLKERDILEDICVGEIVALKWAFSEEDGTTWTGFMWLRVGTNGDNL
jgi:hypothetical protein